MILQNTLNVKYHSLISTHIVNFFLKWIDVLCFRSLWRLSSWLTNRNGRLRRGVICAAKTIPLSWICSIHPNLYSLQLLQFLQNLGRMPRNVTLHIHKHPSYVLLWIYNIRLTIAKSPKARNREGGSVCFRDTSSLLCCIIVFEWWVSVL